MEQPTYAYTQRHVARRYPLSLRALIDIQDILHPDGIARPGRTRNGARSYRMGDLTLPRPIDEGYDSEEAKRNKRYNFLIAVRVIRRLKRNVWIKRTWRRMVYFLCWVCKRKSEDATPLAEVEITHIAKYVGRFTIIDHTAAAHRLVFDPPYREWQSSKVQTKERDHGPYPLRKLWGAIAMRAELRIVHTST